MQNCKDGGLLVQVGGHGLQQLGMQRPNPTWHAAANLIYSWNLRSSTPYLSSYLHPESQPDALHPPFQVDGSSHVVHSEAEPLGTRLTIGSQTCLLSNEHDPSKASSCRRWGGA